VKLVSLHIRSTDHFDDRLQFLTDSKHITTINEQTISYCVEYSSEHLLKLTMQQRQ